MSAKLNEQEQHYIIFLWATDKRKENCRKKVFNYAKCRYFVRVVWFVQLYRLLGAWVFLLISLFTSLSFFTHKHSRVQVMDKNRAFRCRVYEYSEKEEKKLKERDGKNPSVQRKSQRAVTMTAIKNDANMGF